MTEKNTANYTISTMIKDMPKQERPREKLLKNGAASLSNPELIALLLGSGTQDASALMLAERVISADPQGILFIRDCTPEELCTIEGIGPAKSAVIIAAAELGRRLATTPAEEKVVITSAHDAAGLFMEKMRHLRKEHFKVLLLNAKGHLMLIDDVSTGSLMSSFAEPREVFANALRRGAASIILVHNHPSGDPEPSNADICVTENLKRAGDLLGIPVLDHIIIGDGQYVSMEEKGILQTYRD